MGELVERHFGAEVVDRLADPLLSGVYGGDANKLSARAVLPRFVEMEEKYGSLSRAMLAAHNKMRAMAGKQPPRPLFSSLKDGMQQLVDAVVARLDPSAIRMRTRIRGVYPEGERLARRYRYGRKREFRCHHRGDARQCRGRVAGGGGPRSCGRPARHHLQLVGHGHPWATTWTSSSIYLRALGFWCRAAKAHVCWPARSCITSFRIAHRRTRASCVASWEGRATRPC